MDSLSLNIILLHSEDHDVDNVDAFRAAILDECKELLDVAVIYKVPRLDSDI